MPEHDTHPAEEAHSGAYDVSSIEVASEEYKVLTDDEIEAFFQDLDKDKNGYVDFEELEKKLHEVHKELAPDLKKHHITHPQGEIWRKTRSTIERETGYTPSFANSSQHAMRRSAKRTSLRECVN